MRSEKAGDLLKIARTRSCKRAVVDIPAEQPPRPETPSKIHTEDAEVPIPDVSEIDIDVEE